MNPALPPETFTTERLILRRPVEEDAEAIFSAWSQDPEVTKYLVWRPHASASDALDHVRRAHASWEARQEFVWIFQLRGEAKLVGSLACRYNSHGVNLGYLLARPYWGQGLMAEALEPVVNSQAGVRRIWATTDVENRASARVLARAGFELEGTLRSWEVHPNLGDEPRDSLCYCRCR